MEGRGMEGRGMEGGRELPTDLGARLMSIIVPPVVAEPGLGGRGVEEGERELATGSWEGEVLAWEMSWGSGVGGETGESGELVEALVLEALDREAQAWEAVGVARPAMPDTSLVMV